MECMPSALCACTILKSPVSTSVAGSFFGTAANGEGLTSVMR